MSTKPDDVKLALWLEDELDGEELAAFEASMEPDSDLFARREEVRRWKAGVSRVMPAEEEPPYPEFFNSRLEREIREAERAEADAAEQGGAESSAGRGFFWQGWLMPLAACAGMVFAFWMGAMTGQERPGGRTASLPVSVDEEAVVYTPEQGVSAELFASDDGSATVVVLEGVAAIPDSVDFLETAAWSEEREMDSTAGIERATGDEVE